MSTIADRLIEDEGLKRGLARLTPEKIEKTFKALIAGEGGARLKTYLETCVHCGMCAKACHITCPTRTRATRPWPRSVQTMSSSWPPAAGSSPSSSRNAPRSPTPSATCVRRCIHYCPLGIDTGYIMSVVRRLLPQARGHAPVHPGHFPQPLRHHEPDVGEGRRVA